MAITKTQAIKNIMGATAAELADFRKRDPEGFDELGNLCIQAMTQGKEQAQPEAQAS